MLLESDSSWLILAGPYPMLPRLSAPVSGVDYPCPFFHANPLLFASLLSSRQTALFSLQPPTALSALQPPIPSAGSRRQLSFASPYHFRIRRDFMSMNPLSGFAPKQTRLLWRPTHIVLHFQRASEVNVYPRPCKVCLWPGVEFNRRPLAANAHPLHSLTMYSIPLSMFGQETKLRIRLFILLLSGWPVWKSFKIRFCNVDGITTRSL